jgi:NADH-quinone oxidoreductase subunit K
MIFIYFVILAVAVFAIGIAGVVASKNFLIMMLSIEVAIAASTLLAVSFFYFVSGADIVMLLLVIWSVASVEVIALVAFYRYMAKEEISLDVTKLSKLKN